MTFRRSVTESLVPIEARQPSRIWRRIRVSTITLLIATFYIASWQLAQVDLRRLVSGLPRLAYWLSKAWPPELDDLRLIMQRMAETISMAALGTTLASILAIPTAIMASRNITPAPSLYRPVRLFLSILRGIDSFVFALLFVAAVGLGPFAGVLGVGLHTWGSAAKLMADQIETLPLAPLEAAETTGAGRTTAIVYALLPEIGPIVLSVSLFWWEFNVRASTVLGVVGAGGIGQELKNSMDLLDFRRLFTIIAIIVIVVSIVDQLSGWLRARLS
ncbi:phosphonate ABC transporter, permease protein PhnE [Bradyrhizobium cenepequi]|uniref:phosphonate ABC transporter, permease protein PhnE n=1 Tax=Bradyrhizobium cenepequi TaxID=2821403 RepID=UPI001CE23F8D|nr:phosphonate ABC transporter, permease protein PhnE [Bradyrhizobium cenepequi]MCA6112696.1 phosphonate ABC transporter, permease protein PhnE [Bradyrhizobium cenepequi]